MDSAYGYLYVFHLGVTENKEAATRRSKFKDDPKMILMEYISW